MPRLSVQRLFEARRERLGVAWDAGMAGKDREFSGEILHRPGVGLIGHLNLIHPLLAQVMGRREVDYLERLEPAVREPTAAGRCRGETGGVRACDARKAPPGVGAAAEKAGAARLP